MSRSYKMPFPILLFLIFLFQPLFPVETTNAQGTVQFTEKAFENHFPDELVFRVDISSSVGDIVSAEFVSTSESYYSSPSYSRAAVEMSPGQEISLEYVFDTRESTTPPMMPITYYWDVVNENGLHYQSEPITIRYEDTRYNWKVLKNADINVLWHDRPASFGKTVFDISNKAVVEQRKLFQTELDYPIYIVIYNNDEEFAEWHSIDLDWVGGQSFGNYGITAQIVRNSTYQEYWLNSVIPHEISHLYFAQLTYNPTVTVPTWLNEGIAQYNEFTSSEMALKEVRDAARDGEIIPLSSLETGFGSFNEERIYLAYSEGLSAVTFFAESYGSESLSILLESYKEGQQTDEAFISATGNSFADFEKEWFAWIGMSTDFATNTPWPLPTFIPSPTMLTFSNDPPEEAAATSTPLVSTPEPVTTQKTGPEKDVDPPIPSLPCMSVGVVSSAIIGSILISKRKRRKHE